ncbi:MAG: type II and III secretion system protein, partial [Planctomycetes bacterium]|nr:type II and III secretion system protein [Planctomycetota bacterium]
VIKTADKTGTSVIRKTGLEATIGKILPGNFYSTIQLLQEFGTTRIISSPRLYVTNGQSARFMVGSKEAYVTSTVTSTQASTTTSETVEFIDVGITLAVTPTINSDGFIKMSLDPEISQITDRIETAQGNFVPILQTTNVSTEVIVKDGVTIVLAGLIRDEDRKSSSGIPILSKIPILGALFRSTTDVKVKRETVIFVTPYLMTGEADTSIKIRQRDLMEKKPRSLKSIR